MSKPALATALFQLATSLSRTDSIKRTAATDKVNIRDMCHDYTNDVHSKQLEPKWLRLTAQPPLDLLKLYTNTKGTFETRHSFQKGTRRIHCKKMERKDNNKPAQTTPTCHASFPLIVSSHHIPLLSSHGPSTVRGGGSCRDSRPLGIHTDYQASCTSWHSTSWAMWQPKATFASSQSSKN